MAHTQQQSKAPALAVERMQCCDDSCNTVSTHCKAPDAIRPEATVTFGITNANGQAAGSVMSSGTAGKTSAALAGGADQRVPLGSTEKQLVQYLVSGTPAQKHEAAGLLYAETESHDEVGGKKKASKAQAKVPKQHLIKPVKEVMIKGIRRCCDSSCNYVSTVCPNTHALDQYLVEEYAAGKGPSDATLQKWLVSGTQLQKDEAAAVFFAKSHGVVAKERKKLAKKEAAIKGKEAPLAVRGSSDTNAAGAVAASAEDGKGSGEFASTTDATHAVGGGHGHTVSARQAGDVASEAMNIVGDLAAEGH